MFELTFSFLLVLYFFFDLWLAHKYHVSKYALITKALKYSSIEHITIILIHISFIIQSKSLTLNFNLTSQILTKIILNKNIYRILKRID